MHIRHPRQDMLIIPAVLAIAAALYMVYALGVNIDYLLRGDMAGLRAAYDAGDVFGSRAETALFAGCAVYLLFFTCMAVYISRRVRHVEYLEQNGLRIDATIVAINHKATKGYGDTRPNAWQITATATHAQSRDTFTFRSNWISAPMPHTVETGAIVPVIYDAQNPRVYWMEIYKIGR